MIRKSSLSAVILNALIFTSNAYAKEELPHYFPEGVIQSTDSFKQWLEYSRYLTATWIKFNGEAPKSFGDDSIVIETDLESTAGAVNRDHPAKMKLVLDHYIRLPDGR